MASKVVVVEGALRSGSLITAKLALEQGRDLYAVPGNINQPNSIGPNILIEDGAVPIVNIKEIPQTLGIGYRADIESETELTGLENIIYTLVKNGGSVQIDELIDFTGENSEKVLAGITSLELQSFLVNEDGIVHL